MWTLYRYVSLRGYLEVSSFQLVLVLIFYCILTCLHDVKTKKHSHTTCFYFLEYDVISQLRHNYTKDLFSAPEPKAQVHYCDHTLSVVRRPSVRPSFTFTFSTTPLKPLNRIQRNLSASKISMSSTKFVFFRLIGKTRWPPRALIGWDTFDFFSETTEGNATKPDRKQDLNVLYQVCVFRADRKTKMATPASDWLRHYWLLLWNRWTEWEETQLEARS